MDIKQLNFVLVVIILFGCCGSLSAQTLDSWTRIYLDSFSFFVPPEMKVKLTLGIDSSVWQYDSEEIKLSINLGRYSGEPEIYAKVPGHIEKATKIDGRKAKMVFFENRDDPNKNLKYRAAVYFEKLNRTGLKLSFFASCRNPTDQKIAEKIFRSIEFRLREDPRRQDKRNIRQGLRLPEGLKGAEVMTIWSNLNRRISESLKAPSVDVDMLALPRQSREVMLPGVKIKRDAFTKRVA